MTELHKLTQPELLALLRDRAQADPTFRLVLEGFLSTPPKPPLPLAQLVNFVPSFDEVNGVATYTYRPDPRAGTNTYRETSATFAELGTLAEALAAIPGRTGVDRSAEWWTATLKIALQF